jgi:multidrug efflux pump subunit AcrA (membrane-fusion protein)
VPLVAVKRRADTYFVWKTTPEGPIAVPVEPGASNLTHVEIAKGLQEGDEVWLVPPVGQALPAPKEPPPGETTPPANGNGASR